MKTCPNINRYVTTNILMFQDIVFSSSCKPPSHLLSPTANNTTIFCTSHSYRSKGLICDVTRSLAPLNAFFWTHKINHSAGKLADKRITLAANHEVRLPYEFVIVIKTPNSLWDMQNCADKTLEITLNSYQC